MLIHAESWLSSFSPPVIIIMPTVWVSDNRIESGEPFSVECDAGGLRALDRNEEAEGSVLVGAALARCSIQRVAWHKKTRSLEN